jgi:hypothetical protein
MSHDPNDVVRVAAGPMVQVEIWQGLLREAGIVSQVVGDALITMVGTSIPGSIELWVHRSDEARALAVLKDAEAHRGEVEVDPPPHGPVASDAEPPHGHPGKHPHTHYQKDPGGTG